MKCKHCGGNATIRFEDGRPMVICLEDNCGKSYIKYPDLFEKEEESLRLKDHITNLTKSKDVPILISKIKKIRREIGLGDIDQNSVSESLGVTPQRYGNIERCDNTPTITLLMKLCKIFNVTFNDLYEIVELAPEQYDKLHLLVNKGKDDNIMLSFDLEIKEREEKIKEFEEEHGITERKVFQNERVQDDEETIVLKEKLKALDKEYTEYIKKAGGVLKQKSVIDYYHWQEAKKIIGFQEK